MNMKNDHRPKIKKLRRHRSLEHQQRSSASTKSQSTNATFSNTSFTNGKILERYDNKNTLTDRTTSNRQNEIQKVSKDRSIIDLSRKTERSISLTSLPQNYHSISQRRRNKLRHINLSRVTPQQDVHSIKPVNSSKDTKSILKSSKNISTSARQNVHVFDSRSDRIGIIGDHHHYPDQKKKKNYLRLCIILSSIIGFLIVVTIIVVLSVMLTKPNITTSATNIQLRWNPNGTTVAGISGQSGIAADRLTSPFGLAIDYNNTLYIGDYGSHRIQRWLAGASTGTTIAGQSNGTWGANLNQLIFPADVLLDSDSNLYIADSGNSRILYWPKDATSGRIIAGDGYLGNLSNQLYTSFAISRDSHTDTLYVADYGNHRIMRYLLNAATGDIVAGGNGAGTNNTQLYSPTGVYFESLSNSLLIVNHIASNIVRWTIGDNHWSLVAGSTDLSFGTTSTLLHNPIGITLDPMGNMYVADRTNHRIQLFLSTQSIGTTIAGITNVFGDNSTLLTIPYTVALDSQLNLYVVDTGNHRVQKFLRY